MAAYDNIVCMNSKNGIDENRAAFRRKLMDLLDSLHVGYDVDDMLLFPGGIDFTIPSKYLAIAVHSIRSENSNMTLPDSARKQGYHKKQHDMCEKAGYELISLDDRQLCEPVWSNITKKFIVMKIMGHAEKTLYGRDVMIQQEKDSNAIRECSDFLNKNHFSGTTNATEWFTVRCKHDDASQGFRKNEIVGVFSLRNIWNKPDDVEIARVAWRVDVQVRYGLSKISKVIKKLKADRKHIISFSDNRMGNGLSYLKAGFRYDGSTSPSLWFINVEHPTDNYSWQIATSWGAESGVISKNLHPIKGLNNNQAREIVETILPHRADDGAGYYSYYDAGNKRWVIDL